MALTLDPARGEDLGSDEGLNDNEEGIEMKRLPTSLINAIKDLWEEEYFRHPYTREIREVAREIMDVLYYFPGWTIEEAAREIGYLEA